MDSPGFGLRLFVMVVCAVVTVAFVLPHWDTLGPLPRVGAWLVGVLGMAMAGSVVTDLVLERRRKP